MELLLETKQKALFVPRPVPPSSFNKKGAVGSIAIREGVHIFLLVSVLL